MKMTTNIINFDILKHFAPIASFDKEAIVKDVKKEKAYKKSNKIKLQSEASTYITPAPENPVSAIEFMVMLRTSSSQEEKINALKVYVGYNPAIPFGTQEDLARAKALREVKGVSNEPKVTYKPVKNFGGTIGEQIRYKANLEARERLSAERIANLAFSEQTEDVKIVMHIEEQRLKHIRSQMK